MTSGENDAPTLIEQAVIGRGASCILDEQCTRILHGLIKAVDVDGIKLAARTLDRLVDFHLAFRELRKHLGTE
jgi:hypothetical protein